jgi:hypothetical protein
MRRMGSNHRTVTPLPGNLSWKAILPVVFGALTTAVFTIIEQAAHVTIDPTAKVAIVGAVVAFFGGVGGYAAPPPLTVPKEPDPKLEQRDLHDSLHDHPSGA